jgi:hypothetical protein|tara:strand:+ start:45 stop:233 length:189 start_codon:yes stop_codon:yes gene_type:complete
MAGVKARGIVTHHLKRQHNDREIKPCKYIGKGSGKGIMVAQYKDTGDVVFDKLGNPVPWGSA